MLVLCSVPIPTSSLWRPASVSNTTAIGTTASKGFSSVPVETDASPWTGSPKSIAGMRTAWSFLSHLDFLNPFFQFPHDAVPLKHWTILCESQALSPCLLTAPAEKGSCPLPCFIPNTHCLTLVQRSPTGGPLGPKG